jgi:hypothetical protein
MALPEIANPECDAARWAADVAETARARARRGIEPCVAVRRALADGERIRVRLRQCPVAERGDVLLEIVDDRRERAGRAARDLRVARGLAGVTSQAREATHGFSEHTIAYARETDVAVVERIGKRRRESQADAANEILVLFAVEHDRVQHAQRVAAGIEIEAQCERQPAPAGARMLAFDLHDRARGAFVLEGDVLDGALEGFGRHDAVARSRAILPQQDQLAVSQLLSPVAPDGRDHGGAAARQVANERARVDFERGRRLAHGDCARSARRVPRCHDFERSVADPRARYQRMTGPLQRTVGPVGERPGLQRADGAACIAQREVARCLEFSARPRRAPGDALSRCRRPIVEPANPGAFARIAHGGKRAADGGVEGDRCGSGGGKKAPPGDALTH